MQIIISAGGGGTRLWPLSTNEHPKQFVPILDPNSLFEQMFQILVHNFSPKDIWVTTIPQYQQTVEDFLPSDFPKNHILVEPERRDTFAAICSQAAIVTHHTNDTEPLIFVPADDWLKESDIPAFNHALQKIGQGLLEDTFDFITVGITPKYPATNYGYIQIARADIKKCFDSPVSVLRFKEKPDYETAMQYNESGDFLWHKHNPSFTFQKLRKILSKIDPQSLEIFESFRKIGKIDASLYSSLPKIAIDYAIAEKIDSMGVVGMDITWEDIGNWEVVYKHLEDLSSSPNQIQVAGSGNKVKLFDPSKKIAFVGVSGLLIVESEDGLLVIDPKFSPEVKKVAEHFSKKN